MADISISVVYVDERGGLFDESLSVPDNCTIGQAIIQSSFFVRYPNMALDTLNVGVYSLRKHLTDVLHDQDRIEIYRPLLLMPNVTLKNGGRNGALRIKLIRLNKANFALSFSALH
jgi:putative ubiquitin-RnfH superfamily antitoxin RatB of RatAB toxin-antitoxin module